MRAGQRLKTVTVGQRVWWVDPGQGLASGPGTVEHLQYEPVDEETVIALKMDNEGEAEVFLHELRGIR